MSQVTCDGVSSGGQLIEPEVAGRASLPESETEGVNPCPVLGIRCGTLIATFPCAPALSSKTPSGWELGASRVQLRLQRVGGCAGRGARRHRCLRNRPRAVGSRNVYSHSCAGAPSLQPPSPPAQSCLAKRSRSLVAPPVAPTRLNSRHADPSAFLDPEITPEALELAGLPISSAPPSRRHHRRDPASSRIPHVASGRACRIARRVRAG
jgi:hypothetical protein